MLLITSISGQINVHRDMSIVSRVNSFRIKFINFANSAKIGKVNWMNFILVNMKFDNSLDYGISSKKLFDNKPLLFSQSRKLYLARKFY